MDDCLQKILSVLPKNEDGKYAHGCKKELADYLHLPHNIVAEWISGRNRSYLKYLYQISEKYNVSVDWLMGKTDGEKPTLETEDGLSKEVIELAQAIYLLPDQYREELWKKVRAAQELSKDL